MNKERLLNQIVRKYADKDRIRIVGKVNKTTARSVADKLEKKEQ
jgi:hypothetical protein